MGFLLRHIVLPKLFQCESILWLAALPKLPAWFTFPWDAVFLAQPAPGWVPHRVTSAHRKFVLVWVLVSTVLHVLDRTVLQQIHCLLWESNCSGMGLLHGLRSHSCFTIVFTTGFRGISPPVPWALLLLPSTLTLVPAELFFSYIYNLLFSDHN